MPRIDISALKVRRGKPQPVGLHVSAEGTRFTVFSRHATRVWVALFEEVSDTTPCWEFEILAREHRTGDMWSILVENVPHGAYYMYRMEGPYVETAGHRFDATKYLLDPYARAFSGHAYNGTMKSVTVPTDFEWHGSLPPRIPMSETVIYEAHLRGLTRHESSGVQGTPGSYLALIEKLPHLKSLGVTAIELLPVQEIGEDRLGRCAVGSTQELTNYWGYSSIGFFAPAARYASSHDGWSQVVEFHRLVDAIHEAGMEVILDVVFNHTSEGNERGPTLSFRGLDNVIYYMLGRHGEYLNYSGCGNTFNCNHPLVRDFILDSLRYWVSVMHVDGFRFDLASILGRDESGHLMEDPPLISRIAEDPVLRDTKLIAEAWDAGGAYQVGSFGGFRWAEWNGRYRDDVRRYWRGDPGTRAHFALRITGSPDLYERGDRSPAHSINFVTCHDGFTLRDLVSYNHKHNWLNGEGNRDGSDENYSFNCGVEGETDHAGVLALRMKMQKNFIATLFLSLGVPMLLGGDELGRTQRGNNNAYCQDNDVSWVDWSLAETNAELVRFTREMVAFRRSHPALRRDRFFVGERWDDYGHRYDDINWIAPDLEAELDWNAHETALAFWIDGRENDGVQIFAAFNNTHRHRSFTLPEIPWRMRINTAKASPDDIVTHGKPVGDIIEGTLDVAAQSLIVLTSSANSPSS
jgi:isoamylase